MGGRGHLQPIDRLERDVESGVDPNADVTPIQIIVDGRGDAHDRHVSAGQRQCSSLRAVSANHNNRVDTVIGDRAARGIQTVGRHELGTARTSQ